MPSLKGMPSFDVVSEVDHQEVRNAVDQASRELATRFDFKGTDSSIELADDSMTLRSATEDRLKAVRQDIASLNDYEAHLANKVQFLLDAVLGFITISQNDIFKVLTIVSVVGIPPTLIASMYGMNFHFMPEYSWNLGYEYVLGLIAASIILPVAWFKWRGWW